MTVPETNATRDRIAEGSSNTTSASVPRVAFLGFCERAETIREGHIVFWKDNLLGLSRSQAFHVFPLDLQGNTIVLAVYKLNTEDSLRLVFRGTEGQIPFDIIMKIAGAVQSITQPGSPVVTESAITAGLVAPGWTFLVNRINASIAVYAPGTYDVFLATENEDQYLGQVILAHVPVRPYTPEEITALKSDPLATKFIRLVLACNICKKEFKAYAGVEKSVSLETQGFQWSLDITENEFVCDCSKVRISLIPVKTGLHGLLRRNVHPQTLTQVSSVRLYEKTTLEQYCRDLLELIDSDTGEEVVQKFLESHPIFFHTFLPKKIMFKPPILTEYFADFALLNGRDELLLVEIERPQLRLLKKDGGNSAELAHAFHQVRSWKQVVDDHKVAALAAMDLRFDEVAKVKGIVVAGRKPSGERMLRMLRSLSSAEIELFTYDDLLAAVTELIKHVANV